jgi:drug/metabolite transporter (DMT)-like permease
MMNYLLLITSVVMLALASIFVRMSQAPALVGVFWRLFIVSILILPLVIYRHKSLKTKHLKKIALVSLILFFHFWSWFLGVHQTSIAHCAMIFGLSPMMIGLLGKMLLKEPFTQVHFVSLFLGIIGVLFTVISSLTLAQDTATIKGDFLIFVASVLFALYIVLSKKMRGHVENDLYTFWLNFMTSICALCAALFSQNNLLDYPAREWGVFVLMAIFPSLLGHTLYVKSLKHFNINTMSTYRLMAPLISATVAYFLWQETVSMTTIIGFTILVLGVLWPYLIKKGQVS